MSTSAILTPTNGDLLYERRKSRCEIAQALNTPFKQAAVESEIGGKKKIVPLVTTVIQGDYYYQTPEKHVPSSPYNALNIHYRDFDNSPNIELNKKNSIKRSQNTMQRRSSTPSELKRNTSIANYIRENKKSIKIYSRASSMIASKENTLQTPKRPQSAINKTSNSLNQKSGERPQSAFTPTKWRSIASLSTSYSNKTNDFKNLLKGQSPNSPSKIKYKPTVRHTDLINAIVKSQQSENLSPYRRATASSPINKLVPDYDPGHSKDKVSGFEINTNRIVQSSSNAIKSPVQLRSRSTQSFYEFIDRYAREPKQETQQIKLAIHKANY